MNLLCNLKPFKFASQQPVPWLFCRMCKHFSSEVCSFLYASFKTFRLLLGNPNGVTLYQVIPQHISACFDVTLSSVLYYTCIIATLIQCDQIWISKLGLTGTLTSPVNNHLQVTKEWHEESHSRHVLMYIYNQRWRRPTGKGWRDPLRQAQPSIVVIFSDGEQRRSRQTPFWDCPQEQSCATQPS